MNWIDYGIKGYMTKSRPVKGEIMRPGGFIVNELPSEYGPGEHTHFTLKKTNYTTIRALEAMARRLNVSVKRFSCAGNKDKKAVTTQRASAYKVPKERLEKLKIKDIELSDIKEKMERIALGSHQGNEFIITISNVKNAQELNEFIKQALKGLPNFYGPQRFGIQRPNTHLIGKAVLDRNCEEALRILLCHPGDNVKARDWLNENWGSWKEALRKFPRRLGIEKKILHYLSRHPKDYVSALKQPHKRLRLLWINAWQSYEWNNELSKNMKNPPEKILMNSYPMIPEMPELHEFKGGYRNSLMTPEGLKGKLKNDEVTLKFRLGKGEYASIVLRELMKA